MAAPPPTDGTVVVTGASSGIGRELARRLAFEARTLVLVARRADRLEALAEELGGAHAGLKVETWPCDLADPRALARLTGSLCERSEPVDVLINNAGLGHRALLPDADPNALQTMIAVNVTAPTMLTRALLPGMVARGRGGVLNIGSILAFMPRAGSAGYVATKHYLSGFTDSLRLEVAGTDIVVTQACPGPVATEFGAVAGGPAKLAAPDSLRIDPARCAAEILRGFARGKARVYPGTANRWLCWALQIMPDPLVRWAVGRLATPAKQ